jgi:glycerol kinase
MEKVVEKMEVKGLNPKMSIKGIGITNQRETTCVWDKRTGNPLHKALVWLDTRTKDLVHKLIEKTPSKSAAHFQEKCGLPLSTYFSAVKLRWLLDNIPSVSDASKENQLAFGTIDSWLLYVRFMYFSHC